ncbi:MAG TPA: RNA helicase, partial [Firmicutes bacterium]|nr:RNA helicase [Bacillota bacterium]
AGRIERYKENKKQPIVYDYVDVEIPYCERAFSKRKSALRRRV